MDYSLEKRKSAPRPSANASPSALSANASPSAKVSPSKVSPSNQPSAAQSPLLLSQPTARGSKYAKRVYTNEEITNLLKDGYIKLSYAAMWDNVPAGSHIRYFQKDKGANLTREERFRPGGFVRNHFMSNGKKMMMIENNPGGSKFGTKTTGYLAFPIAYDDIEELWKKYDKAAYVEIHMIYNSLANKVKQISELDARVSRLENILKGLVSK